tara:strand:+ start:24 stop:1361 length:1338 start_codon:yes stop_codon:yes gene_type:complete
MANTYLTKTLGTPTNNKKFTFSCWVKRNGVTSTMDIFHAGSSGSDEAIMCRFESEGRITIKHDVGNSQEMLKQTNAIYKDSNAWYHIVTVFDTDNSTAEDRQRIYVNGERITEWLSGSDDNFSQGDDVLANKAVSHSIGKRNFDSANYLDGVLSHVNFCDGQAYDASYFGETDSTTGEWKIKTSPSVTYGNNGFFILKDGNSVTDQSGNSNNWTVSGGTLTQTEDCPSNVFATWNPLAQTLSSITYSNGNTVATMTGDVGQRQSISTLGMDSGKFYMECKLQAIGSTGGSYPYIGIVAQEKYDADTYLGGNGCGWHPTGDIYNGGSNSSTGSTYTTGDIIGVAVDVTNSKLYWHKNGTYITIGGNVQNPSAGSYGFDISARTAEGALGFAVSSWNNNGIWQVNFGNGYFGTTAVSSAGTNASNNGIFEYDVPTGYTALSTKGLNL